MKKAIMLAALLLASQLSAEDAIKWQPSLESAVKEAGDSNKDVIVIVGAKGEALKAILSDPAFAPAGKTFVLAALSKEQAAGIPSFSLNDDPTVYVLDSKGRPYAILEGIVDAKAADYLSGFLELQKVRVKRDQLFDVASKAQGVAKAKVLHEALANMGDAGVFRDGGYFGYDDVIAEIRRLDPNDEGQCKSKWAFYDAFFVAKAAFAAGKVDDAIATIQKFVDDYKATNTEYAQSAQLLVSSLYFRSDRVDKSIDALEAAIKIDPTSDTGKRAAQALVMIREQQRKLQEQEQQQKQAPQPK